MKKLDFRAVLLICTIVLIGSVIGVLKLDSNRADRYDAIFSDNEEEEIDTNGSTLEYEEDEDELTNEDYNDTKASNKKEKESLTTE